IAPEHMLHPVRAIEDADADASLDLVQAVKEHLLALVVEVHALLDEMLVAEDMLVESPGILGEAQRGKRSLPLGQVNRVHRRIADRHCWIFGINVYGRDIQLEIWLGVEQQQLADSIDFDPRHDLKTYLNPIGILVPAKFVFRAADFEN